MRLLGSSSPVASFHVVVKFEYDELGLHTVYYEVWQRESMDKEDSSVPY